MSEDQPQRDELPRVRFSMRQLLGVSTVTCIVLGAGVGGAMLVLFLASSFLPGIALLAALVGPQFLLFVIFRRWLPKVKRDPIEDDPR